MAEFNSDESYKQAAADRFPNGMPMQLPGASATPPGAAPAQSGYAEGRSVSQPWMPSAPLQPQSVSGTPDDEFADVAADYDSGDYAATGYGAPARRETPASEPAHRRPATPTANPDDGQMLELFRAAIAANPDLLRQVTADPQTLALPPRRNGTADFANNQVDTVPKKTAAVDRPDVAKTGLRGWFARTFNVAVRKSANEVRGDVLHYAREVINSPLDQPIVIGVTSFKGGCGKTPVTVLLGGIIAATRNEPVLAIDADLHGTLVGRGLDALQLKPNAGNATLLAARLHSYGPDQVNLADYTHRGEGSLHVLPGNVYGKKALLTREQYRSVLDKAREQYRIVIVDMSQVKETDLYDEVMKSLDALVMLTTPTESAVAFQENMATFLRGHEVESRLGLQRITMINHIYARDNADIAALAEGLRLADRAPDDPERRVEVCELPFDKHIALNTQIHLDHIAKSTRDELVLAAGALFDAALNANPTKEQSFR